MQHNEMFSLKSKILYISFSKESILLFLLMGKQELAKLTQLLETIVISKVNKICFISFQAKKEEFSLKSEQKLEPKFLVLSMTLPQAGPTSQIKI